ncbi:hypothetical protein D3C78_1775280 [compost metagenome]
MVSVPVNVLAYSARRLLPAIVRPKVRLLEWVTSSETAPMDILRPAPKDSAWKFSVAWVPTMADKLLLTP